MPRQIKHRPEILNEKDMTQFLTKNNVLAIRKVFHTTKTLENKQENLWFSSYAAT